MRRNTLIGRYIAGCYMTNFSFEMRVSNTTAGFSSVRRGLRLCILAS